MSNQGRLQASAQQARAWGRNTRRAPASRREGGSQAGFGGVPAGDLPVLRFRRQFGSSYAEGVGPADHPQKRRGIRMSGKPSAGVPLKAADCCAWGDKKHRAAPVSNITTPHKGLL